MDSVRSASDLVLASILSVSAKVMGHHEISTLCIDEAKTLTRCTMFPVRYSYRNFQLLSLPAAYLVSFERTCSLNLLVWILRNHNFQDLKGIMALAIYHGTHLPSKIFTTPISRSKGIDWEGFFPFFWGP